MFGKYLSKLHNSRPLIHCITNYVTANDCANILLACGASPIMTDDIGEVEEIAALSAGLCINLGTLNQKKIPSMLVAGRVSRQRGNPTLLDPVGAGSSKLRTSTALRLIDEVGFDVIRGNLSEIRALSLGVSNVGGVDSSEQLNDSDIECCAELARSYAISTGAVIVITGEIDIVADSRGVYFIRNGHPIMSRITGTGCQLSALMTAFIASNRDNICGAAAAAVCAMGVCGELAATRMSELDGNASCRNYLIDAIFNLSPEKLDRMAKYSYMEKNNEA
ncbi:MAG: hydroxyethylthiazole kinase [Clostridiales bacterium]|nr:hydroxyethylthiazole kinase [Clostridiales bacterium]